MHLVLILISSAIASNASLDKSIDYGDLSVSQEHHDPALAEIRVDISKGKNLRKAQQALHKGDAQRSQKYKNFIKASTVGAPLTAREMAERYENKRHDLVREIKSLKEGIFAAERKMHAYQKLEGVLRRAPLSLQENTLSALNTLYHEYEIEDAILDEMQAAIEGYLIKMREFGLPNEETFEGMALDFLRDEAARITEASPDVFDLIKKNCQLMTMERETDVDHSQEEWNDKYEKLFRIKEAVLYGNADPARRVVELYRKKINALKEKQRRLGASQVKARSKELAWATRG